jgi:hypothetical protein
MPCPAAGGQAYFPVKTRRSIMLRVFVTASAMAVASLMIATAAIAHNSVSVNVAAGDDWRNQKIAHRAPKHPAAKRTYYSGAYASVARADGATYVHAYPGVRVYVGAGGDVDVSIGF